MASAARLSAKRHRRPCPPSRMAEAIPLGPTNMPADPHIVVKFHPGLHALGRQPFADMGAEGARSSLRTPPSPARQLSGPWSASCAFSGKAQRFDVAVLPQRIALQSGAVRGVPGARGHDHPTGERASRWNVSCYQSVAFSSKRSTGGSGVTVCRIRLRLRLRQTLRLIRVNISVVSFGHIVLTQPCAFTPATIPYINENHCHLYSHQEG